MPQDETVSEAEVLAACRAECDFDKLDFDGLSRLARQRYMDRCRAALTAAAQVRERGHEIPASFIGPVGRHGETHETLHRDGTVEWAQTDSGWFKLTGDERLKRCATDRCGGQPTWRLESEGVGANYCSGCMERIISSQSNNRGLTDKNVSESITHPSTEPDSGPDVLGIQKGEE